MVDIFLFEFILLWSYFFIVLKKFFTFKSNLLFTIFVSNISLFTFIITIIMGLMNFEFLIVLASMVIVMISVNFLFRFIYIQYLKLSKKVSQLERIKPVIEYGIIIFVIYKIIF